MQPLLRFGSTGLLLLLSFAAPAARADQPLDEPAPFGVIQFSPDEAWIDLPYALADSWTAMLAVLTELKYDVKLDAAYVTTNGQIRVADLWVAVEPHGSRDKSFTRIRVALDKHDDEYSQVRAEVILDAVATRLAPPAPAPAPAPAFTYADQPVDPGVQDTYTGAPVATSAYTYAYDTPGDTIYNTYNTYNTYDSYGGYPTPYYANYGYYSPFCNYYPYWGWNHYGYGYGCGGWNGGYWCNSNSWASGPTFTYWNCPTWGISFGCNPWWNFGFSGCWGNFCASTGFPWSSWGGCGNNLVVIDTNHDFGNDVVDSGGNGGKPGNGVIGVSPNAGGLHAKGTAKPVPNGKAVKGTPVAGTPIADASDGRTVGDPVSTPGQGSREPGIDREPRSGSFPRIQITHRERNAAGPRFDPRTTVTRTVDTHTIDTRGTQAGGADASRGTPTTGRVTYASSSPSSSLPHMIDSGSAASRGKAQPGKVVRMSSPSYRPGFVGVIPGSSRPVSTVDGTTSSGSGDGGVSHGGSGNPYASTPTPVANHAPSPSAPAPVFNGPGTISFQPAPQQAPPSSNPAPRSSGPSYAPPPVAAPRVSAPAPSPSSRPPAVSAPSPSFGGGSPGGSFGGSSGGHGGGSSGGASAGHGGGGSGGGASSGKGGGRGRP